MHLKKCLSYALRTEHRFVQVSVALENPYKQVVWMTSHTKQYSIQGLGLKLSTMSEDVTVSLPEGIEGIEVSLGNQPLGLRLRNTRTSETSPGGSVTWVLSHQDIPLELETQFKLGMRET